MFRNAASGLLNLTLIGGLSVATLATARLTSGPSEVEQADGRVDATFEFVAVVLALTEEVWSEMFQSGALATPPRRYDPPRLVLYSESTSSACGTIANHQGPLYCPLDLSIYLDPIEFDFMAKSFGAPGDFAAAYVIAHEVGHHVQELLGLLAAAQESEATLDSAARNALSVRIELQADCYAGVWARQVEMRTRVLEVGDLDEALRAAFQLGDDAVMRRYGEVVDPRQYTHGDSIQRRAWFDRGYRSGAPAECDTFSPTRQIP